ncbi:MAG: hypothetical protein M1833_003085 [Piccolia ochrophora]|nr:MAG: hypothetical protein M1833_003085 [Piccolia ochrophora]
MASTKQVEEGESSPDSPSSRVPLHKTRWDRMWPVIACGAGLLSDGYLNNAIGYTNTILGRLYPKEYKNSSASSNVSSIAFAGTVVGQLSFGYFSDHYSRKWSLMASTVILIVFAALCAGSYGAGGSLEGLFAALTAWRFFLGIGIGGEYPAGSVACAESAQEVSVGKRNRTFIIFTNVQIDIGFVLAAIVATVLAVIFGEDHMRATWRTALGLGVIPPLSLFYLRLKLQEPEEYKKETMRDTKTPWILVINFSIYSSAIIETILGDSAPLWKSFAWSILINAFLLPGCIGGAYLSDFLGPRDALAYGVLAQGIVGFIMAGAYAQLATPAHIAGFVVIYGIFTALGELGPGDNIGLVAAKTSATSVRGKTYGIAAAIGKCGAFAGSYCFPIIQKRAPTETRSGQDPFFVASSLCVLSAVLAKFCLPYLSQEAVTEEDHNFRVYLLENGYDTSKMGLRDAQVRGEDKEEHGSNI